MAKPTSVFFANRPWSLGLIFLLLAGQVFAQAEDAFQKLPDGVEESEYEVRTPASGEFQGQRVQPPNWFVDLPRKRVEVLLYDEGIGEQSLTLVGKGASLEGVKRLPNKNYLIAEVLVHAGATPGKLRFESSSGRGYDWGLALAKQPRAMSPADLVYLIMPDRFANGDPSNDSVSNMAQTGVARDKVFFRHGGDLRGIINQLDYLKGLGVTTLWLNPVLENDQPYESYHGYAVTDHYRIDRRFGSLEDYLELVREGHKRDIKTLMDIVPNHVGDRHYLYADMPAGDWFHQPESFTRSNFRTPSLLDPHAAESDRRQMLDGWFDKHMPDFNQDNPHVRIYFEQVALWWLGHSGQDGYRVDTYPYSDPDFMAEWSETVHRNFPSVSFFGEVWVDGLPNQASFVPGNQSPVAIGANPSVTDFQLKDAILEAINQEQGWASGVGKLWLTLTQDYLYADPHALITFLDNHDLTRAASAFGSDEQKMKSALTLLLTLRGTPMLNYGTEIGMEGSGGAFGEGGRKDMPGGWAGDDVNAFTGRGLSAKQRAIRDHVTTLAGYRRNHPGMATGKMTHFVPEGGIYAYLRHDEGGNSWLVVYNSNKETVTAFLGRYLKDLPGVGAATAVLTATAHVLTQPMTLQAKEAVLLELH